MSNTPIEEEVISNIVYSEYSQCAQKRRTKKKLWSQFFDLRKNQPTPGILQEAALEKFPTLKPTQFEAVQGSTLTGDADEYLQTTKIRISEGNTN